MDKSKLTKKQKHAIDEYKQVTGFYISCIDEFEDGMLTFDELWAINLDFIYSMNCTVQNIYNGG